MDEVAPDLYVGTTADAADESLLASNGVETVVSLTHSPPETGFASSVTVTNVPMLDGPRNQRSRFVSAVDETLSALQAGDTVLVHCSRGASRSPSVAAVVVARRQGQRIESAFEQVGERRDAVAPHDAVVRQAVAVYRERDENTD